jgi:hypothetical protein
MIDVLTEDLISLKEFSRMCPPRRNGKRPVLSCVYRWVKDGIRGVRLETICIGGTRCTSREAAARFFSRITAQADGEQSAESARPASTPRREAAADRLTETELAKNGI